MTDSTSYSNLLAGIFAGGILYVPIGPNGILALSRVRSMGYRGIVPTAIGSILSCFIVALVGSSIIIFFGVSDILNDLTNFVSAIVFITIGILFFQSSRGKYDINKHNFNFKNMLISAFLVGISNPKGIVGFPVLFISFAGSNGLDFPLSNALFAALGAVISATCWWVLFYVVFRYFDIERKPFFLRIIIEFFSLLLIIIGIFKLIS